MAGRHSFDGTGRIVSHVETGYPTLWRAPGQRLEPVQIVLLLMRHAGFREIAAGRPMPLVSGTRDDFAVLLVKHNKKDCRVHDKAYSKSLFSRPRVVQSLPTYLLWCGRR